MLAAEVVSCAEAAEAADTAAGATPLAATAAVMTAPFPVSLAKLSMFQLKMTIFKHWALSHSSHGAVVEG